MKKNKTSFKDIILYTLGEGGTSIAMNGISNFALIFYTRVMGLSAGYAGLALSITIFLNSLCDPVMGHISDNTRSRFGRRHSYMFIGGILLAISFFFLWCVPDGIESNKVLLFFYLIVISFILKAALTVYVVPFTALGFEICTDYEERSKLQGIRFFLNMLINFIFGAMAWTFFFRDSVGNDGMYIDGSMIESNYMYMGIVLSVTALIMTLSSCFFTKKYIIDSREMKMTGNDVKGFLNDFCSIIKDKNAQKVFLFLAIAQFGMFLTAQLQIFVYVDYMHFSYLQKTFVHGSTMIGFALGSLAILKLVKILEKRNIALLGSALCIFGGIMLYIVFCETDVIYARIVVENTWLESFIFTFGQFIFWTGCGIIIPLATSMIADISEINQYETGILKDGSFSAMFSFILKAVNSIGLAVSGIILGLAGYIEGVDVQGSAVSDNIAIWSFLCGPVMIIIASYFIIRYPITRQFLDEIRKQK